MKDENLRSGTRDKTVLGLIVKWHEGQSSPSSVRIEADMIEQQHCPYAGLSASSGSENERTCVLCHVHHVACI